jgi:hypothetical protein
MDAAIWISNDQNFKAVLATLVLALVGVVIYAFIPIFWNSSSAKAKDLTRRGDMNRAPHEDEGEGDEDVPELGNLMDPAKDPDILYGSTERYDWNQTESEVEMFVKLSGVSDTSDVRAKNIKVSITSTSMSIAVNGTTLVKGDLFAKVLSDDCTWQLEEPRNGEKVVWITLFKAIPTARNQHWKSVLKGDATIDVSKFGPPVHGVDTSSPASMKKAIQAVRAMFPLVPLLSSCVVWRLSCHITSFQQMKGYSQ